ncbi:MAG: M14 family metallopeptidase [Bdellovibrionota bacterium]
MKNLFLIFTIFLSINAFASDFPDHEPYRIQSDSGIFGPPYKNIVEELFSLEKAYPEYSEVIRYGTTIDGRPLSLIKIAKKSIKPKASKAIYIAGAIHGDEYLNIEDRLPRWFLEKGLRQTSINQFFEEGGSLYIIPILNPDGYDRRRRQNSAGYDLNRDFDISIEPKIGFSQPETIALKSFLNAEAKLERKLMLSMDYHCCTGAVLYPWSFTGPTLPMSAKNNFVTASQMIKQHMGNDFEYGTCPDILGYDAHGTSKDHYYEAYQTLAFTFEGRRNEENKYFDNHTAMWISLVDLVNKM